MLQLQKHPRYFEHTRVRSNERTSEYRTILSSSNKTHPSTHAHTPTYTHPHPHTHTHAQILPNSYSHSFTLPFSSFLLLNLILHELNLHGCFQRDPTIQFKFQLQLHRSHLSISSIFSSNKDSERNKIRKKYFELFFQSPFGENST